MKAVIDQIWDLAPDLRFWFVIMSVFTVFTRGLTGVNAAGISIDYVAYPFFMLAFVVTLFKFKLSTRVIIVTVLIGMVSLYATLSANYGFGRFLKYFGPIVLIYFTLFHILRTYPVQVIFELYVEMAFISAIIGLFQFVLKALTGIRFLTVFDDLAVDSVAGEPSHYAVILMPALIYTTIHWNRYRTKCLIMFLAMLLTLKLTSYVTFFLTLLIAYFQLSYLIFLVPIMIYLYYTFILTNSEYTFRIFPVFNYITAGILPEKHLLHGTPLSFISNLQTALYCLSKSPLIGVGFGGHEKAYFEVFTRSNFPGIDYLYGLNSKSGHSLLIRMISETGLIGITIYIITLLRNLIVSRRFPIHRAIAIGCLSHFIGKSIKLGSYIDYGTPFFFVMMIINLNQYRIERKNAANLQHTS